MKRQGFTREVFAASLSRDDFVLLSIPLFARRDDFVGQVGNLRRIVNPPAGSEHNTGESPEKFAACRYAGQPILPAAAFFGASSGHARIFVPSRVQPGLPAPQIVQS